MTDTKDERITRLSQRFSEHETKPPKEGKPATDSNQTRTRRSLYLDKAVFKRVDETHRELNHQLYPLEVEKFLFLEAIISYGLDHLEEIKPALVEKATPSRSG